jgi:hypothetical protein
MAAALGGGLWMDAEMLPKSGQGGGRGRNKSNYSYTPNETATEYSSLMV